ncbi:MAG: DUF1080 domain-containing protein, partial [Cyclobacteriaceae bacterium]|nr:DUF1080 domain-containing protein [Cyclobacteriaceae bacterium]
MKYLVRTSVILMFFTHFGWCQSDGFIPLPLQDLSSFKEQSGNWLIVGDVLMDPEVSVHQPPAPSKSKKKKKKRKQERPTPPAVQYTAGSGILLNMNNEEMKDALLTNWEHSDIDISLEVMLPKGSNSGIYLQGRYEVQLYDSWGVMRPKFSDIGGIYRNWESEPGKIYMGKAPLSNPSKAPGLWQKLDISFRAPKFDLAGNKIANAKLVFVDLNGVRIHENVEIPLPTGGPVENNEKHTGPLMIQGDHGPVAIRNFKYRSLKELEVKIDELQYQVFHGSFKNLEGLSGQEAVLQGKTDGLTCTIAGVPDKFALVYSGTLAIPETGEYQFDLAYTGGAFMTVNGQEVINYQRPDGWWRRDKGSLHLDS